MSARFEQKQWTQTVRRGPIAAEIQTPAPNFVELPPLIGYKKIAVSTKPTASAFSFGQKHKDLSNNSVNGPGPAKYDITGLSNRVGRVVSRESTLGSRPRGRRETKTPGPGEYEIEKVDKSKSLASGCKRGFTFGHRSTSTTRSHTPAPNEYSIPTVLGTSKEGQIRSAPAYTIIGRHKKLPQPKTIVPGPGAYDGKFEIIFKSSPQFSIAERLSRSEKVIGPGPGAHHPEKVNLSHLPAFSFGIKHSQYIGKFTDLKSSNDENF